MSKYIIELDDTTKAVQKIAVFDDGRICTHQWEVEDLEELNSDYINEHFGDLQDVAYKRGFEDAKANDDKGCEGCKYQANKELTCPCSECANNFKNQWTAKKQDDEINVGDEVDWDGAKFVVTRIFKPYNQKEQCDGVDMDGCVYADVIMSDLTKTGRHFNIDYLEEMKG